MAKFTVRSALAVLVLTYLLGGTVQCAGHSGPAPRSLFGFGARLAIADLDGDDRLDRAELSGTGYNRLIKLRLSRSGTYSVLAFDTASLERGSLFAQDVNNDGQVDLIWTDMVHPDSVIIWLNDGLGRFARAGQGEYASRFIIGASCINKLSELRHETAVGSSRISFGDLLLSRGSTLEHRQGSSDCKRISSDLIATGLISEPTYRGPPTSRL